MSRGTFSSKSYEESPNWADSSIHEVSNEQCKVLHSLRFRILRELEVEKTPMRIALDRLCVSGLRGDIRPDHVIKLVSGKLA